MCSTLEYASSRLMSPCPMMNAAATARERSPNAMSTGRTKAAQPRRHGDLGDARHAEKGAAVSAPAISPPTRLGASP